uniref:Uncharacterized protein n=1 Tax=Panagrolaimus sp. PS1159 TaxID=55785 RepID=A0AC35F5Z3_9BILA
MARGKYPTRCETLIKDKYAPAPPPSPVAPTKTSTPTSITTKMYDKYEIWPSLIQQPKVSQAPSRTATPKPMERTVKSADVDKKKVEEEWSSLSR